MLTNAQATILARMLREAEARTVSGAFKQFLDKEINIAQGIREIASNSHNHMRDFLATECDRDATFPRILSINDSDFVGGSFARHVKNWPLDDIDIYFPLDGQGLIYTQNGLRLPYAVVSDDVLSNNPLLHPRWMIGSNISSRKLLSEFAGVLRRHYPGETKVRANGQAVSLRMKQGETESGDGLGYDVVPCFFLKPDNPQELPFYLIPDGFDGWIRTNPRYDQQISEQLQKNNEKTFRKVVRLLKYWNTERLFGGLSSYYIELTIARAYLDKNDIGQPVRSVSFGVALGFWALREAVNRGSQMPWIAGAPPIQHGSLTLINQPILWQAQEAARQAWDYEAAGNQAAALKLWADIFGPNFPQGA